jgi:hypothetical protein
MTKPRKTPQPKGIPSLRSYVESLDGAAFASLSAPESNQVANDEAFSEMKGHVLGLYEDVEAVHSFVDQAGGIFDCIPIEQQPALRDSTDAVPTAPDRPVVEADTPATRGDDDEMRDSSTGHELGPNRQDWFGNAMQCPRGTIPMRRVTLEALTRFPTLRDYMQKGPSGAGRPPRSVEPATVPASHRWAHAYQNVNNVGGQSFLNIWRPGIGANQVFSLSQQWYVGGSGNNLQTAECGWQVYPQFYGDAQPHLFCYWTADAYNTTGCYNLSCNKFVQTSSTFAPGMALGPISVSGGAQYQIELAYYYTGAKWWLYFNGNAAANAIGYYPGSLYGNGALSTNANEIDYGGETVGTTSFPAMGSGAFANQGYQRAAYQRTVAYYPSGGGGLNASLTAAQATPSSYTAQVALYAAPWSETVWFGGPGGN